MSLGVSGAKFCVCVRASLCEYRHTHSIDRRVWRRIRRGELQLRLHTDAVGDETAECSMYINTAPASEAITAMNRRDQAIACRIQTRLDIMPESCKMASTKFQHRAELHTEFVGMPFDKRYHMHRQHPLCLLTRSHVMDWLRDGWQAACLLSGYIAGTEDGMSK